MILSRVPIAQASYAPRLERLTVGLIGLYILAQCFSLPVLSTVLSWALWPTLPDILLWLAGGSALLYRAPMQTLAQRRVFLVLLGVSALALGSFLLLFVMRDQQLRSAISFGLYGLYKVIQLVLIFFTVSRIELTPERLARWGTYATVGFAIMVITIAWTSFSPALPDFLGTFLPHGRIVSGAWEAYYLHNETGLGAIGYNHGYVALQVLTLGTLLLMLRRSSRSNVLVVALIVLACFLTGSRAGLAGALLLAALEYRRTPVRAIAVVLGLVVLGLALAPLLGHQISLGGLADRQVTIVDAGNADNLSGRDGIWSHFTGSLLGDPLRMLLGSGFGSAINNGGNAHFNLLQILYEMGVAGLVTYALLFWTLIRELWDRISSGPILHLLVALWFTAMTQETFYPEPAFGGFLPLLSLVLAVGLGQPLQRSSRGQESQA